MITIDQLKALTEFLTDLGDLSNRTGVFIGDGSTQPYVEVGDHRFDLIARRDEDHVVYALETEGLQ